MSLPTHPHAAKVEWCDSFHFIFAVLILQTATLDLFAFLLPQAVQAINGNSEMSPEDYTNMVFQKIDINNDGKIIWLCNDSPPLEINMVIFTVCKRPGDKFTHTANISASKKLYLIDAGLVRNEQTARHVLMIRKHTKIHSPAVNFVMKVVGSVLIASTLFLFSSIPHFLFKSRSSERGY